MQYSHVWSSFPFGLVMLFCPWSSLSGIPLFSCDHELSLRIVSRCVGASNVGCVCCNFFPCILGIFSQSISHVITFTLGTDPCMNSALESSKCIYHLPSSGLSSLFRLTVLLMSPGRNPLGQNCKLLCLYELQVVFVECIIFLFSIMTMQ